MIWCIWKGNAGLTANERMNMRRRFQQHSKRIKAMYGKSTYCRYPDSQKLCALLRMNPRNLLIIVAGLYTQIVIRTTALGIMRVPQPPPCVLEPTAVDVTARPMNMVAPFLATFMNRCQDIGPNVTNHLQRGIAGYPRGGQTFGHREAVSSSPLAFGSMRRFSFQLSVANGETETLPMVAAEEDDDNDAVAYWGMRKKYELRLHLPMKKNTQTNAGQQPQAGAKQSNKPKKQKWFFECTNELGARTEEEHRSKAHSR